MHQGKNDIEYKHKIVNKYFDTVYRLALSQLRDPVRADDVLQETFLRYIKTDKSFDSEEHIKAWLIRVTINCVKSTFTASWNKKTVPITEDIPVEMPETEEIYQVVARLPRKYRTVVHLFYYEDMSIKEISKVLSLGESTVKSQLHRAREMLRSMLGGGYEIEF